MATQNIALRISGTKIRKAGFSPLVAIGLLPPAEEHDLDRALQVGERPGFIIKHAADYISYRAIDSHVRSVDADASGTMSIAITIPSGMQLAGGASPYDLLMEIYRFFKDTYMTPLSDGRDVFINTEYDNEQFRAILARYPLEERKSRYVTMNPSGATGRLCLPQGKLARFFSDSQYSEMSQFKDVEVGTTGHTSPQLDSVQVPRPKSYKLKINGIEKGSVSDINQPIPARASPSDRVEYTPVTFTIADVIAAGGMLKRDGAMITLNETTETIDCTLESKPITYRVRINWLASTMADEMKDWLKDGEVTISHNGNDCTKELLEGKCSVSAGDITKEFKTRPTKYRNNIINVIQKIDQDKREVSLQINVTPERRTVLVNNDRPTGNSGNGGNGVKPGNHGYNMNKPADNRHTDVTPANTTKQTKGEQQRAFFFGILIGFILGLAAFYAINEFLLNDKQAEQEQTTPTGQNTPADDELPTGGTGAEPPVEIAKVEEDKLQETAQEPTKTTETSTTPTEVKTTEKPIKVNIPTPETLEDHKKQLVETYNNNLWKACKEIIKNNKELKKYQKDLEFIFTIRQNKAFDSDEDAFKKELSDVQIANLLLNGFITPENKPTDKFKIKKLEDIASKKTELENCLRTK